MTTPQAPKLTQPLRDLAAWTAFFKGTDIPVLGETAQAIELLRANEDRVDANSLGEMIAQDPLMSLKLLAYSATHRSERVVTDVETVTSALVMMGISPFFRTFGPQPTVDDHLHDEPEALRGLHDTLQRAHRGANYALSFAVHRMDHDAAIIHTAALLHDFCDMLLWCHAPALCMRIGALQRADPGLRSTAAQRAVLGIELADLQQALMKAWRLPELLVQISDDRHADHAKVRTVMLALRLARHSAHGWDNPALPDDIAEIADLLNLSPAATLTLVHDA